MTLWFLWLALALGSPGQDAEKPWERKVQLPVPVPVELPALPPTNPFYLPLASLPQAKQTPMRENFPVTVPVRFAIYVDKVGNCRRAHPLSNPLPGILEPLRQQLLEERLTPGKAFGQATSSWVDVQVDLRGKVAEGQVTQLVVGSPDPSATPEIEGFPLPPGDPRDAQLPATPVQQLTAIPSPGSFSAKVPKQEFRQPFKLLAEVSATGKVKRIVFLLCPEGLQSWVLASSSTWLFTPARTATGATDAWALLSGVLHVRVSPLRANALRVARTSSYPAK